MRSPDIRPSIQPQYTPEPHLGLTADGLVVLPGDPKINSVKGRVPRIIPVTMALSILAAACVPGAAARPGAGVEPTPLPPGFIPADPPPQGVHPRVEQVAPEATATTPNPPEVKTQPCAILPPDSCSQARERKPVISSNGVESTYIVFTNSSEEKIPIFVAEDGQFLNKAKESGAPFSGIKAQVILPFPPGGAYIVSGDLSVEDMIQVKDPKKGIVAGYVIPGGTVYMTKTKRTPEGPRTDEVVLRELFPEAYKTPPLTAYDGPVKPTVTNYYDSIPVGAVRVESPP